MHESFRMKLSIAQTAGEEVRVALAGHVTQREVSPLQDPLIELLGPGGYGKIVRLDLSEAEYVDSSGIGWLLSCHKRIKQAGGRLLIERPHPIVANVFRVLKLERVFELADASESGKPTGGAQ
jgi:Anti-anti-sigma regulatory factor (antagonist of anti-sigma factor)